MTEFALDRTEVRENFKHYLTIPTRWSDNDRYGHVNNARYLTFFEVVIMRYLEVDSKVDFDGHGVQCFSVENMVRYIRSVQFPDTLEAGLRIGKLGNSSVRYEVGLLFRVRTIFAQQAILPMYLSTIKPKNRFPYLLKFEQCCHHW